MAVAATQVELSINCTNLPRLDTFSKSDPFVVLFVLDPKTNTFLEHGRTEVVEDDANAKFVTKFHITYFFEEVQKLLFQVYDADSKSNDLSKHDFIGQLECTLANLVTPPQCLKRDLVNSKAPGRKNGQIIVTAEELASTKGVIHFQLSATNIDKKDFFGKSDGYLTFVRANENMQEVIVHKTEVVMNTLNPTWKPFSLPMTTFCNGDLDRTITVNCYDWDKGGSHDFIGSFSTNLRELSSGRKDYELINKEKLKKKGYKNSGILHVHSCSIELKPTFLDYIAGGCDLSFSVAVDFTQSNGNPNDPKSLHYQHPTEPNEYIKALQSVGTIIQEYDSDKLFPAFGFGAKLPNGVVTHQFALNGVPENPFCSGIDGVISAYAQAIQAVQLWGPTNFAPIINHVASMAQCTQDNQRYFILLMITDGVITDMDQTKAAIVAASRLPMSIIIVGVGNADFTDMHTLDSDGVVLMSGSTAAARDIVQFVPFCEYRTSSAARLAKDVLAELPEQLVEFMEREKIKPCPPRRL